MIIAAYTPLLILSKEWTLGFKQNPEGRIGEGDKNCYQEKDP